MEEDYEKIKYTVWTKAESLNVKASGTHGYHRIANYHATMPKHPAMHETKSSVLCWHWTRAAPLKRDNIVHLRCPLVGLALYCTEKGGQLTSTAQATPIILVYISVHKGVPHPT